MSGIADWGFHLEISSNNFNKDIKLNVLLAQVFRCGIKIGYGQYYS